MVRNGFTLVEMMVVLLVMALAGGAVMMTIGGDGRSVAGDAARLASRIAAAREDAIASARPVSLWISPSGYGFDLYRGGAWQPQERGPLASHDWPRGTEADMSGIGARGGVARLTFDNLGLPEAPATIALTRDDRAVRIEVAANGDVAVR